MFSLVCALVGGAIFFLGLILSIVGLTCPWSFAEIICIMCTSFAHPEFDATMHIPPSFNFSVVRNHNLLRGY